MKDTYHIPWYNKLARNIILPAFRLIFNGLSKLTVEGMENFPKEGPYLIIFNHVSLYDAPVVVSHLPEIPEVLGASDIWNRPGQDFLARAYGGIPIHRGEVDRNAMYKMLAAIKAGHPLMIAPEGGRSQKPGMRRGKPGIIFLLEKNKLTSCSDRYCWDNHRLCFENAAWEKTIRAHESWSTIPIT